MEAKSLIMISLKIMMLTLTKDIIFLSYVQHPGCVFGNLQGKLCLI